MSNDQFLKTYSSELLEQNGFYNGVITYSNGNIKVSGKPKKDYLYKSEFVSDLFNKLEDIKTDYLPFF